MFFPQEQTLGLDMRSLKGWRVWGTLCHMSSSASNMLLCCYHGLNLMHLWYVHSCVMRLFYNVCYFPTFCIACWTCCIVFPLFILVCFNILYENVGLVEHVVISCCDIGAMYLLAASQRREKMTWGSNVHTEWSLST